MALRKRLERLEHVCSGSGSVYTMTDAELLAGIGLPPETTDEEALKLCVERRAESGRGRLWPRQDTPDTEALIERLMTTVQPDLDKWP